MHTQAEGAWRQLGRCWAEATEKPTGAELCCWRGGLRNISSDGAPPQGTVQPTQPTMRPAGSASLPSRTGAGRAPARGLASGPRSVASPQGETADAPLKTQHHRTAPAAPRETACALADYYGDDTAPVRRELHHFRL
jgi:hypothetical protein